NIWEQDDDSEEDQKKDGDDRDTFDMWDITVEDVERIRKFFNVPDEIDEIILNVAMVDEEADFNPTKDLEELEKLLTKEPQSNFTKIQVDRDIISPGRHHGVPIEAGKLAACRPMNSSGRAGRPGVREPSKKCLNAPEDYAMAVRASRVLYKKGRFVETPWNDKEVFKEARDDKMIRTKEILSEALGAVAVKKMTKRSKMNVSL
ncbi:hypothetical protein Tco_0618229, partial [Tanacetum coccineum]